jgi:UDP-glucose 4-epimerase
MKILFTGASSFTGFWFIRELANAGHDITAVFRRPIDDYSDPIRRERVQIALQLCRPIHNCRFGDSTFLDLVREGNWDLLCHHAADVTNYKSQDFDVADAIRNNTSNLVPVLRGLKSVGCGKVLLTGSVFEEGEGSGSDGMPNFSPYGLSKAITAQVIRYYCEQLDLGLGKFVIPNPFGPYEDARFTAYLLKSWLNAETPVCSYPLYVRDNIHVALLSKAYASFVDGLGISGFTRLNPSGYVETQEAFTLRVAREMQHRLRCPCLVEFKQQVEFPEPRVRINTDTLDTVRLGWVESEAWDELANYYENRIQKERLW